LNGDYKLSKRTKFSETLTSTAILKNLGSQWTPDISGGILVDGATSPKSRDSQKRQSRGLPAQNLLWDSPMFLWDSCSPHTPQSFYTFFVCAVPGQQRNYGFVARADVLIEEMGALTCGSGR
jgi:hypothetical protein